MAGQPTLAVHISLTLRPKSVYSNLAEELLVFVVRLSRGGQVARALLGERFGGILVTDRYSAYNWYPVRWRQLCWAHLLRDFAAMRERGGAGEEIGDALLAQAHQMFAWWHRVREGTLKR